MNTYKINTGDKQQWINTANTYLLKFKAVKVNQFNKNFQK